MIIPDFPDELPKIVEVLPPAPQAFSKISKLSNGLSSIVITARTFCSCCPVICDMDPEPNSIPVPTGISMTLKNRENTKSNRFSVPFNSVKTFSTIFGWFLEKSPKTAKNNKSLWIIGKKN